MTLALELSEVAVTYPARRRGTAPVAAVRGASMALQPGRVLGLVGQNGAGKTTLMEACIGALEPTAGSISWFGEPSCTAEVRRRIGFCPDVPAFASRLTVREHLLLMAALDSLGADGDQRVKDVASRLALSEVLGRRVETLSRGTAQRLGVAQALLRPRDLLVCDETFAPLDPTAQVELRDVIREEAARGAAVLISSHQLDQLLRLVDELLVMRDGVIVHRESSETMSATKVVILDAQRVPASAVAEAVALLPSAWAHQGKVRAPWRDAHITEEEVRERYPQLHPGIALERVEDADLEKRFIEISKLP